jgi:ribulose kinase
VDIDSVIILATNLESPSRTDIVLVLTAEVPTIAKETISSEFERVLAVNLDTTSSIVRTSTRSKIISMMSISSIATDSCKILETDFET